MATKFFDIEKKRVDLGVNDLETGSRYLNARNLGGGRYLFFEDGTHGWKTTKVQVEVLGTLIRRRIHSGDACAYSIDGIFRRWQGYFALEPVTIEPNGVSQ